MRPRVRLRTKRSIHVAIATIMLAVPASAFALTRAASNTDAANTNAAPVFTLHARVTPRLVDLGRAVTAIGITPASEAGHWMILQTAATRHARWRFVAATTVARTGRFSVRARLRHSGFVRVVDATTRSAATAAATSWSTNSAGAVASTPQRVRVTAKFSVAHPSRDVLGGQRLAVRGRLMPWRSGPRGTPRRPFGSPRVAHARPHPYPGRRALRHCVLRLTVASIAACVSCSTVTVPTGAFRPPPAR